MNKTIIFTTLLMFFSFVVYSQPAKIYVEVIYGKEIKSKRDTSSETRLIPGLEYKLEATPSESLFRYVKKLSPEGDDLFLYSHARATTRGRGGYTI